jgi:hypothetical protein
VVPLARQRQQRRVEAPTLLALLPAGSERWCLQRPAQRRVAPRLWPEAPGLFLARAAAWGVPVAALEDTLVTLHPLLGEWLCARSAAGQWLLAGARLRLHPAPALAARLNAAGEAPLALGNGLALRVRGDWCALASDAALLEDAAWLDAQPRWLERDDLLLGKDWLEYRAAGAGGALLGVESDLDRLLAEGLAWDCADGVELLSALCPGPALTEPVPEAAALDSVPLLRHSGPLAPGGQPLALVGCARGEAGGLRAVERRWAEDLHAALSRVIWRP